MPVLPEFAEHKSRSQESETNAIFKTNVQPNYILGAGTLLYGVCALISGELPAPVEFTHLRLFMTEETIRLSHLVEVVIGTAIIEAPRGIRWLKSQGLRKPTCDGLP